MRVCLNELGPPPAQLPRSENRSVQLPLVSKWDQTKIDANSVAADQLTKTEFLYYDTKALFVQILRLSPTWAKSRPLDLLHIADMAAKSKNAVMVTKGLKISDMMQELISLGTISKSDGFKVMVEEIQEEIQNLGDMKTKVQEELNSLNVVYKTIQDHNDYLRSQIETYKAYLQNVRVQAGSTPQKAAKSVGVPKKFTYQKLDSEGIISTSTVPENR